jgi:hypothetical protein
LTRIKVGIIPCTAAVVLTVMSGVQPTLATRFICFVIQPGDTAATLALRLTGDVAHRREPWFQIVDPGTSRYIRKAEYGRILPGWHVCVAQERIRSELLPRAVASEAARPLQPIGAAWFVQPFANVGITEVSWGVGVLALVVTVAAWRLATRSSANRRTLVIAMTLFGERFIREFERPLLLPGSDARALESRLRFIPRQRRLDILLAPRNGHSYPNLSDHRANVEYDVGRVLQRLKDERFVSEPLSVQGRWVIVRFSIYSELGGGT